MNLKLHSKSNAEVPLNPLSNRLLCIGLLIFVSSGAAFAQQPAGQSPTPAVDNTRKHPRIAQVEVPGRRIDLKTVKGARLFAGPQLVSDKPVPLIVHFHGASWLIETHIARNMARAALITVNLGAGSSVYGRPFEHQDAFQDLIDEARQALGLKHNWSSITLTGFSAGYGAVRAILRHSRYFDQVNNVLLLDGMHASYLPEAGITSGRGTISATDMDSFLRFAREAAGGRKTFFFSHSEIFPGTYASTTECADYLLAELRLRRRREFKNAPGGMQLLSGAGSGRLRVFGYAGDTAADHVDHLHAMPVWLKLLRIK